MEDAWASGLYSLLEFTLDLPPTRKHFLHAIYRIFFSKIVYIFMDLRQARDLAKDIYDF